MNRSPKNPRVARGPADAEALVREVIGLLELGPALSIAKIRSLNGKASVPETFADEAVAVASHQPKLVERHFDLAKVEEARAWLERHERLRGAVDALHRRLEHEALRREATIGDESRKLYRLLRVLVTTKHEGKIVLWYERMKKLMRAQNKKKR